MRVASHQLFLYGVMPLMLATLKLDQISPLHWPDNTHQIQPPYTKVTLTNQEKTSAPPDQQHHPMQQLQYLLHPSPKTYGFDHIPFCAMQKQSKESKDAQNS
jgi:hypothetical protein